MLQTQRAKPNAINIEGVFLRGARSWILAGLISIKQVEERYCRSGCARLVSFTRRVNLAIPPTRCENRWIYERGDGFIIVSARRRSSPGQKFIKSLRPTRKQGAISGAYAEIEFSNLLAFIGRSWYSVYGFRTWAAVIWVSAVGGEVDAETVWKARNRRKGKCLEYW